jgi:hypothetical protein
MTMMSADLAFTAIFFVFLPSNLRYLVDSKALYPLGERGMPPN